MEVNCVSCGRELNLNHWIFDHYSRPAKCFSCGTMMSVKTIEGKTIAIDPLPVVDDQLPMYPTGTKPYED